MALLRGGIFAGSLYAGALFGLWPTEAVEVEIKKPGGSGGKLKNRRGRKHDRDEQDIIEIINVLFAGGFIK